MPCVPYDTITTVTGVMLSELLAGRLARDAATAGLTDGRGASDIA